MSDMIGGYVNLFKNSIAKAPCSQQAVISDEDVNSSHQFFVPYARRKYAVFKVGVVWSKNLTVLGKHERISVNFFSPIARPYCSYSIDLVCSTGRVNRFPNSSFPETGLM